MGLFATLLFRYTCSFRKSAIFGLIGCAAENCQVRASSPSSDGKAEREARHEACANIGRKAKGCVGCGSRRECFGRQQFWAINTPALGRDEYTQKNRLQIRYQKRQDGWRYIQILCKIQSKAEGGREGQGGYTSFCRRWYDSFMSIFEQGSNVHRRDERHVRG